MDQSLYAYVPDSQLKITEKGKQQAYVSATYSLKLVSGESMKEEKWPY